MWPPRFWGDVMAGCFEYWGKAERDGGQIEKPDISVRLWIRPILSDRPYCSNGSHPGELQLLRIYLESI